MYSITIAKLRQQNQFMRAKLTELNESLDHAFDKIQLSKQSQQVPEEIQKMLKIKQKELQANNHINMKLRDEVLSLTMKMDAQNQEHKKPKQYEQLLKEAEKKNQELLLEMQTLQKISNE